MLILTSANVPDLELVVGYQLTCTSCTARLFIESGGDIATILASAGWQQAETEHEHLPCVCRKCVAELKENEQELQESN